ARVDRRLMLIIADVLRLVIIVTVPLLGMLPWPMAAAFLVACLNLLWAPTVRASLPAMAADEETRAAARRSANRVLFGPALAAAPLFAVVALVADATLGGGSPSRLPPYVAAPAFPASPVAGPLLRWIPPEPPVRAPPRGAGSPSPGRSGTRRSAAAPAPAWPCT